MGLDPMDLVGNHCQFEKIIGTSCKYCIGGYCRLLYYSTGPCPSESYLMVSFSDFTDTLEWDTQ
jgi:hypothetical protein